VKKVENGINCTQYVFKIGGKEISSFPIYTFKNIGRLQRNIQIKHPSNEG
jgi:hypothetical protein